MSHTDRLQFICAFAILGIVVSLISRASVKSKKQWKSTISIIATDYTFENYATISAASFIYAVLQGAFAGAALFCATLVFIEGKWLYAVYSLGLALLIALSRLGIEGYIAIYKTSKDASMFFTLSSKKILSENKYIVDIYGDDFNPLGKLWATSLERNPKPAICSS